MAAAVDKPTYRDPPATRAARQLQYLLILAEKSGVDLATTPRDRLLFDVTSAYERRGYTPAVIQNWIQSCDPEEKPAWDEVACFRHQVEIAMKPTRGLGTFLALAFSGAFLGSFLLSRARK